MNKLIIYSMFLVSMQLVTIKTMQQDQLCKNNVAVQLKEYTIDWSKRVSDHHNDALGYFTWFKTDFLHALRLEYLPKNTCDLWLQLYAQQCLFAHQEHKKTKSFYKNSKLLYALLAIILRYAIKKNLKNSISFVLLPACVNRSVFKKIFEEAAAQDNLFVLQKFIEAGINVTATTALHRAVFKLHPDAIRLLLTATLDVNRLWYLDDLDGEKLLNTGIRCSRSPLNILYHSKNDVEKSDNFFEIEALLKAYGAISDESYVPCAWLLSDNQIVSIEERTIASRA